MIEIRRAKLFHIKRGLTFHRCSLGDKLMDNPNAQGIIHIISPFLLTRVGFLNEGVRVKRRDI